MEKKILEPTDAETYRNFRLEALLNHPEAFSSSYEEEKEFSLESFERRLNDDHSFTFGMFDNGQLMGIVTLVLENRLKLQHRAKIVGMYVEPAKRRSGIGKQLMLEAIKKAKESKGVEQIYLSVISNNEPARQLYSSLGFETYGTDQRALKVGNRYLDDELMMLFV
ncbi:GNAT family N-acetyltransferase [Paenibacillus solisilvae]|uniref:GNAT family N-acetyltransferase n=1 Tax=Paenibacillus solisilvae TaxID=2486751 RepID=A0ABW0W6U6_9BACL